MAVQGLVASIKDDREEDTKALWRDETLTPLDRAKSLYYALLWQKDGITEWLLYHLDMPVASAEALLSGSGAASYFPYGKLLLTVRRQRPSSALLMAAVCTRVPCPPRELFDRLLDVGGWALVWRAMEAGGALEPPGSELWSLPDSLNGVNAAFIAWLLERDFPGFAELCMFYALRTTDLPLLRRAINSAAQYSLQARASVLPSAVRAGWVEGVRALAGTLQLSSPSSVGILKAAVRGPSLACLDVLLDLGKDWRTAAFWVAFFETRVGVLDHVVRRGGLPPVGTPIPCIPFWHLYKSWLALPPPAWAAEMAESSTLGGPLPGCVAALVAAAKAGRLEAEIRRWNEPADLVLFWSARESREYTRRLGTGGPPHVPHVPASVMRHAGIATPEEFSRAAAIAGGICQGLGIHFRLEKCGRDRQGRQGAVGEETLQGGLAALIEEPSLQEVQQGP